MLLDGVPAAPSPGLLIYAFGPTNPAGPVTTSCGNLCLGSFISATATVTGPDATTGGCTNTSQDSWSDRDNLVVGNKAPGANGCTVAGIEEVWIQAWQRDPSNPGTANSSKIAGPFYVSP